MFLDTKSIKYLKGEEFSEFAKIQYVIEDTDFYLQGKIGTLSKLCKNKNVIHVGCIDHSIEIIKYKLDKDKWLHKHLIDVANYVIGVDIHKEGLEYISENYGYHTACLDITQPHQELKTMNYDYILIPDVLEHIGNPVEFLSEIRKNYSQNIERTIITVPNAFCKKNYKNAVNDCEYINTDHRFWFTPYTLCKVLIDSGYTIESIQMLRGVKDKKSYQFKNKLYKLPFLRRYFFQDHILTRNTILVVASLKVQ